MLVSVSVRFVESISSFKTTHYYEAPTDLGIKNDKKVVINIR